MKSEIISYFANEIQRIFEKTDEKFFQDIEEIRLRVNKPLVIYKRNKEYFLDSGGRISENINSAFRINLKDIKKTLDLMCGYSIYAFEEEIKNGYITLQSGHRVGITGQAVVEDGKISTIKNINGLNLRISHEILNCADSILPYITKPDLKHTMIISPPACGKTTLLRDIIRQISDGYGGKGRKVGLVDERSEIAGCYLGIPQNDVGQRTDILDSCPKSEGMRILLRSMSPELIAVDEIGKNSDIEAIDEVINAGVKLICTVHGNDILDILKKPVLNELLRKNIFEIFIVLGYGKKPGEIIGIFDSEFNIL